MKTFAKKQKTDDMKMKNKTNEIKKILGQIRLVRKQKGLTQESIATVIGVERSTYVRKESGAIPLTLGEFIKIAEFLEIDYNVSSGKLALVPKTHPEILQLVHMIESLSKDDKDFLIENTKKLIKFTKRK